MLNEIMAQGPNGVRVLLAPISPELADLITNDHVRMVMAELRKTFDYVIVDTSCHLADFNLEVIESAQHILVVTALTIPAIKDAKLALKVLESLTVDPASVLLVVDRSDCALRLQQGLDRAEPPPQRRRADPVRPARGRRFDQPWHPVRDLQPRVRHQPLHPRARRGPRPRRRPAGRSRRRRRQGGRQTQEANLRKVTAAPLTEVRRRTRTDEPRLRLQTGLFSLRRGLIRPKSSANPPSQV